MPKRPLLELPAFEEAKPLKRFGRGPDFKKPSRERQDQRFQQKFALLKKFLDDPEGLAEYHEDPQAIAPERAVVFELAGSVAEFYEKCSQIGFEFLAADEFILEPDEDFHYPKKKDKQISGRIYFAMPSKEALRQFLRLWRTYKDGVRMPRGGGVWKQVFELLKDVRAWGPEDRLTEGVIKDWEEHIKKPTGEKVRFEVELWFRENEVTRGKAFDSLKTTVAECGGKIVSRVAIPAIRYHAALIELPDYYVHQHLLQNQQLALANKHEIMFIRPQSTVSFPVSDEKEEPSQSPPAKVDSLLPPIAALFDGLPLENHSLLKGRLEVDDPEESSPPYEVVARNHGTAMASLIIHGDLRKNNLPINHKLYVRRIMEVEYAKPLEKWVECNPKDKLITDCFFQAILRLKEGEADEPPASPNVFMINVSLGDERRIFSGLMSPWARLLDYMAYRYKVLFIVSAGNVMNPLPIKGFNNISAFEKITLKEREKKLFSAIDNHKAITNIISPAESINALTIGAAHNDDTDSDRSKVSSNIKVISQNDLPNLSSRKGLGFGRSIKPDLLTSGGKESARIQPHEVGLSLIPADASRHTFGLLAAASTEAKGDLSKRFPVSGTSAATALVTRAGHLIYEALTSDTQNAILADTPPEYLPLIVKALLVHSTKWGGGANMLRSLYSDTYAHHTHLKDNISRYIGHGVLDISRIIECTANRATLIGYRKILPGSTMLCRIPLPQSLEGAIEPRVVTVTLAWFTPINARHQNYRGVALMAKPLESENKYSLGVEREKLHPDIHAIARGTVFHDRRTGNQAVSYINDGFMLVNVSAQETAGKISDDIAFAMAVSIEVEEGSQIHVYDEIRQALLTAVKTQIKP